jgi:hypothetical protein
VAKFAFLSDDWFDEADKVIAQHEGAAPAHANVKVNIVVTGTPFPADVSLHMGAENGEAKFGKGHLDAGDVTLTTDYATAKDLFVSGNPQAGMQAFMSGKVKVQGDMTKLMASQGAGPGNPDLAAALQEITE